MYEKIHREHNYYFYNIINYYILNIFITVFSETFLLPCYWYLIHRFQDSEYY